MTAAVQIRPLVGQRVKFPAALPAASQAVVFRDDLQQRAVKLWPATEAHFEHNRAEWIASVQQARAGKSGWQADVKERSH